MTGCSSRFRNQKRSQPLELAIVHQTLSSSTGSACACRPGLLVASGIGAAGTSEREALHLLAGASVERSDGAGMMEQPVSPKKQLRGGGIYNWGL